MDLFIWVILIPIFTCCIIPLLPNQVSKIDKEIKTLKKEILIFEKENNCHFEGNILINKFQITDVFKNDIESQNKEIPLTPISSARIAFIDNKPNQNSYKIQNNIEKKNNDINEIEKDGLLKIKNIILNNPSFQYLNRSKHFLLLRYIAEQDDIEWFRFCKCIFLRQKKIKCLACTGNNNPVHLICRIYDKFL